jgi:tripartite-type tricarboxylate transporter receptor subunit TctC
MTAVTFVTALMLAALAPASAQNAAANFPNRPIKIVVPFPAGGPTDVNMRIIGQKLSENLGQGVVIENRPGANTGIAAQMVARAAPDGYTLLAAMDTTLVMNPATGTSMTYDPFKDFAPITLTAKNTSLLTVRAEDGPRTAKELIARGKASPKKLTYGAGIIITRLAGLEFAKAAGIEVVLVPYKGSSEVVHGLLTGSVDFIVDGVAASLPLIQSGKLRPLAKLNKRPLSSLPDVPFIADASGLPLPEMSSWIGLVAPAGTPPEIVSKLQREVARIYADSAVAAQLDRAGINAVTTTPAEFDKFFRDEAAHWTKAFKASGIKF